MELGRLGGQIRHIWVPFLGLLRTAALSPVVYAVFKDTFWPIATGYTLGTERR